LLVVQRFRFDYHYRLTFDWLNTHLIGQLGRLNASDWLVVAETKSEPDGADHRSGYGDDDHDYNDCNESDSYDDCNGSDGNMMVMIVMGVIVMIIMIVMGVIVMMMVIGL
jgi:hypothetical protein